MFITTNTRRRCQVFLHDAYAREAIDTLYRVQQLHPFFLYGFVIMPDHCHFLLRVPAPERISTIMNVYKCGVSHNIGIGPLWQSRFHMKIAAHADQILSYMHFNPVKVGLVADPKEYPWSSASGKWDVTVLEYLHGSAA